MEHPINEVMRQYNGYLLTNLSYIQVIMSEFLLTIFYNLFLINTMERPKNETTSLWKRETLYHRGFPPLGGRGWRVNIMAISQFRYTGAYI